jgi:putative membrane protein
MPHYPAPFAIHAGAPLAPHDLAAAWATEPAATAAVLLLGLAYGLGLGRLRRRAGGGRGLPRSAPAAFAAGWLALAAALVSPLDALGGALFAAHMAQHELLMAVAAPLLVAGRPELVLLWALPERARRRAAAVANRPALRRAGAVLGSALVAWTLHAAAILGGHVPAFYEATLRSDAVHAVQHAAFLGTALLFWWSLLHGAGARRRYGIAVLSVFTTAGYTGVLGALLALGTRLWYPAYATTAPVWGLTPLEDQQLAGVLMWVPAGLVYTGAALALVVGWLAEAERRVRLREAQGPVRAAAARAGGVALCLVLLVAGCGSPADAGRGEVETAMLAGGDPLRGPEALRRYGCQGCHAIPGLQDAPSLLGPPLARMGSRTYIAGVLPNTPENMVRWIQDPRDADPRTAMPNLGVTERDARDMASYLYRLR